ncbi:MAG: cyclic nucleotide-binding domain-containing protein [Polyangiaceae bacterium]|nr:cyclic nucleotide-binding domain-containing protein [Polyangiaceae bacterium]
MTGASSPSALIPEARDDDDDDVAWALQTAAVQWKRGARAEAVGWLRRAAEAAVEAGVYARARDLNSAAASLEHAARLVGEEDGEDYDGAEPILEVSEEVMEERRSFFDETEDGRSELPTLSEEAFEPVLARPVPRAPPPPVRVLRPPPKAGVVPPAGRASGSIRPSQEAGPAAFPPVSSRPSGMPPPPRSSRRADPEDFAEPGLPELPSRLSAGGLSPSRPSLPVPVHERASSPGAAARARVGRPLPPPPNLRGGGAVPEPRARPLPSVRADKPPAAEPESTASSGRGSRAAWSFAPDSEPPLPLSEPLSRPATRGRPAWSFATIDSEPPVPQSESSGRPLSHSAWGGPQSEAPPESFRGSDVSVGASDSFAPKETPLSDGPGAPPGDLALESEKPGGPLHRFDAPYREKAPSAEELDLADAEELPISEVEPADEEDDVRPLFSHAGPAIERRPFSEEPTARLDLPLYAGAVAAQASASDAPTLVSGSVSSRASDLPAAVSPERPPESIRRGIAESRSAAEQPESASGGRAAPSWPPPSEPAHSELRAASAPGASAESVPPASHWSEAPTAAALRMAPSPPPPVLELGEPSVGGIRLADVRGLQDLPEDAQARLAATARVEMLAAGEELGFFAVALVVRGWFRIMPAVTDTPCARVSAGEVVFTTGTIEEGLDLCVRAAEHESTVAVWDRASLEQATADCPWVADELRIVADGFQALAGAAMGRLGDRLDESLRTMVTSRCDVRTLRPGEVVAEQGQRVPGMHIVGAGRLELISDDGRVDSELGPGEFLFSAQVLSAGAAPKTARAGKLGALVLVAERKVAHELVTSVPPLLELLAEE